MYTSFVDALRGILAEISKLMSIWKIDKSINILNILYNICII